MKIILCIRSMIFSHLSVEGLANNTTEEGILVPMDLTFLIEFTLFSMSIGVIGIFSTPASIKQALVLLVPAFAAAKKWNLMKAVTETAAPSPPHCTLCPESMEYVQEKLCLGGIFFPPQFASRAAACWAEEKSFTSGGWGICEYPAHLSELTPSSQSSVQNCPNRYFQTGFDPLQAPKLKNLTLLFFFPSHPFPLFSPPVAVQY